MKEGIGKKMLQYMETVSQGEAENIRKTIQDLFRQTCILQVKCDPATLVQHDNPRYQVCLRHREFIADYLSVLDCELVHDPQEHIFRMIELPGAVANLEDFTPIYIYSTVNVFCSAMDINELVRTYQDEVEELLTEEEKEN